MKKHVKKAASAALLFVMATLMLATLLPAQTFAQEIETMSSYKNITVTVTVTGQGAATGGGTYRVGHGGKDVTLTATPDSGWRFVRWRGDFRSTDNPATLTLSRNDRDKNIIAVFEQIPSYALTVNVVGDGSVTKDPQADSYLEDTIVELTASAADGWRFIEWSGDLSGSNSPASVKMTGAKSVTATFKQEFTLSLSATAGGKLKNADGVSGTYVDGDKVNVACVLPVPDAFYYFAGWRDDNNPSAPLKPFIGPKITMDGNKSYTAVFKGINMLLSATAGANGKLGTNINGWYEYGSSLDLNNAKPEGNTGYEFKRWEKKVGTSWVTVDDPVVTIGVLNVYRAVFGLKEYDVRFFEEDGCTQIGGTQTIKHGSFATAPADLEKTGHTFVGWSNGSQTLTKQQIEALAVTAPVSYKAVFTANTYTVTFESNGGSAVAAATALYDTLVTKPADPARQYHSFAGWYKDAALTQSWDFAADKIGDADMTLYAKWTADAITKIPSKHTMYVGGRVTWSPQPPNGVWAFDSDYLSKTQGEDDTTFKALKKGVTIVTYEANGVSYEIEVTILETELPVTGQISTWIWVLGGLGICTALAAVILMLRKRRNGAYGQS